MSIIAVDRELPPDELNQEKFILVLQTALDSANIGESEFLLDLGVVDVEIDFNVGKLVVHAKVPK